MIKLNYKPSILPVAALTCLTFLLPSTVKADEEAEPKAKAEVKHPIKPFLWKLEGKNQVKPSYLFGTIHVSNPSVTTLHPAAQKAFDHSDYFYAEVNMSTESQMKGAQLMMRKDGKNVAQSIGNELSLRFDEELKHINPQLNSAPFQSMKTWLVAMLPSLLPDQMAGKKPLDLLLWEAATAAKKNTVGLETIEAQTRGFDSLTEPEQIIFLKLSLDQLKNDREAKVSSKDKIIEAYIQGDETKIIELAYASFKTMMEGEHKILGKKIMDKVLIARDKTISESILKALKKDSNSSHFFAVGTGHYCTEKSILSYLRDAGYTITRINK